MPNAADDASFPATKRPRRKPLPSAPPGGGALGTVCCKNPRRKRTRASPRQRDRFTRRSCASTRSCGSSKHGAHHPAKLAACLSILHSESFKPSVREAVHSVIAVLSLRGKHFRRFADDQLGPVEFGMLLDKIDVARRVEIDPEYDLWLGRPFAEWLNSGEVLTRHREAFDWSRLLLGSRAHLMQGDRSAFMRSQLSVLLSMWHAATTEDSREYKELDEILGKLGVVRAMKPTFAAVRRQRKRRQSRVQTKRT